MFNKIRRLKIIDIIFLVLLGGFFLFLMTAESEGPNDAKEQVTQQEPWLTKTSNYIFNYMNDPEGNLWISNNGVTFMSIYSSPHFLPEKLESLRTHLVEQGWYELPPQDSSSYEELVTLEGQKLTNTVVLCNNKAAITIWMDDLSQKYVNMTEMKTMIRLSYDYKTPCFDLGSKKN